MITGIVFVAAGLTTLPAFFCLREDRRRGCKRRWPCLPSAIAGVCSIAFGVYLIVSHL